MEAEEAEAEEEEEEALRTSAARAAAPAASALAAERQFLPEPSSPWIRRTFVVVAEASPGLPPPSPPPALEVSEASSGREEKGRRRWWWRSKSRRKCEVDFAAIANADFLLQLRNALSPPSLLGRFCNDPGAPVHHAGKIFSPVKQAGQGRLPPKSGKRIDLSTRAAAMAREKRWKWKKKNNFLDEKNGKNSSRCFFVVNYFYSFFFRSSLPSPSTNALVLQIRLAIG